MMRRYPLALKLLPAIVAALVAVGTPETASAQRRDRDWDDDRRRDWDRGWDRDWDRDWRRRGPRDRDCYTVRRRILDDDGDVRIITRRVCED